MNDEFIEILKVSEQIKNAKKRLGDLGQLSETSGKVSRVEENDLNKLKNYEQRLDEIDRQIKDNTNELDKYMVDAMAGSENNQFTEANVNFEIESLNMKLNYLVDLKKQNKKP